MVSTRIAVLMTSYNRKDLTIACLDRLYAQEGIEHLGVEVFLTDDASTDGTSEEVGRNFPKVRLLEGDGTLFWCGGMRLAFEKALSANFNYYLWLNNDTMLFLNALRMLFDSLEYVRDHTRKEPIIVGSTCAPQSANFTYGGWKKRYRWLPLSISKVEPIGKPRPSDTFDGNCVLIPHKIAKTIGNISKFYRQGMGDRDYGLRAGTLNVPVWICAEYVGTCKWNNVVDLWKNTKISTEKRIASMNQPAMVLRIQDWIEFTRRNCRILWPFYLLRSTLRLRFPRLWICLRTKALHHRNRS